MADIFDDVAVALDRLESAIVSAVPQKEELSDLWGWNTPVLSKDQIAERAGDLASRIRDLSPTQKVDPYVKWLSGTPSKIDKFISVTLPNLAGGNAGMVVSLMDNLLKYIEGRLPPQNWPTEWEAAADAGQLPLKLARKLRALEAKLAQLEPRADNIDAKIQQIEDAHSAAETLPTDLASLQEARDQVSLISTDVIQIADRTRSAGQVAQDQSNNIIERSK